MDEPEGNATGLEEKSDGLECMPDKAKEGHEDASTNTTGASQHLQEDMPTTEGKSGVSETEASNSAQELALPDMVARSDVAQNVAEELEVNEGTQQSRGELDIEHGSPQSPDESSNKEREHHVLPPQAVLNPPGRVRHIQVDTRNNVYRASSDTASSKKGSFHVVRQLDASETILDLVGATQNLKEDPTNVECINNLIGRLKNLLLQERQSQAFMRQNSDSRNKIESLHNLIQYLESQVRQIQKASRRRGLRYYLASISNKVRGHEVGRIGRSIELGLQSWLDQQRVREVAKIISKGSEDAQVHAISSFESIVQKGYNSLIQETILSAGLVEKLAGLLAPGVASWQVAKEAVRALSTLIDFNKNIFLSQVLMAKTVENILNLMNTEPDEHVLILTSVMKHLLSMGHTVVMDELFAQNGVSTVVELLDRDLRELQLAAMDCVFELAYFGRVEVVDKMFELEVVKKLALLQQLNSSATEGEGEVTEMETSVKDVENPLDLAAGWMLPMVSSRMQDVDNLKSNPFGNAVTKFALHLSIGTGLRKREKMALKQEFLRQIKEVMEDDAEVANITAEVLWAP